MSGYVAMLVSRDAVWSILSLRKLSFRIEIQEVNDAYSQGRPCSSSRRERRAFAPILHTGTGDAGGSAPAELRFSRCMVADNRLPDPPDWRRCRRALEAVEFWLYCQ